MPASGVKRCSKRLSFFIASDPMDGRNFAYPLDPLFYPVFTLCLSVREATSYNGRVVSMLNQEKNHDGTMLPTSLLLSSTFSNRWLGTVVAKSSPTSKPLRLIFLALHPARRLQTEDSWFRTGKTPILVVILAKFRHAYVLVATIVHIQTWGTT